jgi:hypothetical protein
MLEASPAPRASRRDVRFPLAALARAISVRVGASFHALLAVGSVGRAHAEGATAVEPEDYDLIVVARGLGLVERKLRRRSLDRLLHHLGPSAGRPVSIGILSAESLPHLPFTLFNYEMRNAHLLLAGSDPTGSFPAFPVERMPLIEATRLLLNRGVPLWGDALALRRGQPAARELAATASRNRKAVMAIGDALLIREGRYHWSYGRRMERAARCAAFLAYADARLGERYRAALEAKLGGSPPEADGPSVRRETEEMLELHARVLRDVEERRLGRPIRSWNEYLSGPIAYPEALAGSGPKRLFRLLRDFGPPRGVGFYRHNHGEAAESVLLRTFPALAYGDAASGERSAGRLLNWRPPRERDESAVWERFHAVWSARG